MDFTNPPAWGADLTIIFRAVSANGIGDQGVIDAARRVYDSLVWTQEMDDIIGLHKLYQCFIDNIEISFGLRGGSADDGPRYGSLLDLQERVPTPILADWDGDGTLDLLAQTPRHLLVWKQTNGAFSAEPQVTAKLPVEEDFERAVDVSHATRVCDLDGDGRADLVIFARDKNSDDVRTQVLVYVQARAKGQPPFGAEGPFHRDALPTARREYADIGDRVRESVGESRQHRADGRWPG